MKRIRNYLIALTCLGSAVLFACDEQECGCGCFSVGAEYLYLHPTIDDTGFVIEGNQNSHIPSTQTTVGNRKNNDASFHSAFRILASYSSCPGGGNISARWTHYRDLDKKTIRGASLMGSEIWNSDSYFMGAACNGWGACFNSVDVLFGMPVFCCNDLDLTLQGGLQWISFKFRDKTAYVSATRTLNGRWEKKEDVWGIGPEVALQGHYRLCDFSCFCPGTLSVAAMASCSLIANRPDSHYIARDNYQLTTPLVVDVAFDKTWRMITACDARVGLNYCMKICCFATSLEAGYELMHYNRLLAYQVDHEQISGNDTIPSSYYSDFNLDGPYVALNVFF